MVTDGFRDLVRRKGVPDRFWAQIQGGRRIGLEISELPQWALWHNCGQSAKVSVASLAGPHRCMFLYRPSIPPSYMYICIYIYVYMYICIYVYVYICIYVYMYIIYNMNICVYVYMYEHMYFYMH